MEAKVRLWCERAEERLATAKYALEKEKFYNEAIIFSFFSMYSMVRALIRQQGGTQFSRHSEVIRFFDEEYIITGIFDKRYLDYLQEARKKRNICDYEDFVKVDKTDAETQCAHAEEFVSEIRRYLEKEYGA